MPKLPEPEILAMMISNSIFINYGVGPSQSICLPFAEQVIAEADKVKGW